MGSGRRGGNDLPADRDGERMVGSWQAGAPAEGLAHFARRFDDMLTEVELLRPARGGRR